MRGKTEVSGFSGAEALLRADKVPLLVCCVCARGCHELPVHVGTRCCKGPRCCQPCSHRASLTGHTSFTSVAAGHAVASARLCATFCLYKWVPRSDQATEVNKLVLERLNNHCGWWSLRERVHLERCKLSALIEFDLSCTVTYSPFSTPLLLLYKAAPQR